MTNMSNVTIEGFVTANPVVKKTKTGKNICDFSVAVNHNPTSEGEPKVSFFDVETWEGLADYSSSHIKKGSKVIVFGTLKQDRWENTDGKIKSKIKIVANTLRNFEKAGHEQSDEKIALSA